MIFFGLARHFLFIRWENYHSLRVLTLAKSIDEGDHYVHQLDRIDRFYFLTTVKKSIGSWVERYLVCNRLIRLNSHFFQD